MSVPRLDELDSKLAHAIFNANASGTGECIMDLDTLLAIRSTLRSLRAQVPVALTDEQRDLMRHYYRNIYPDGPDGRDEQPDGGQ